MAIVTIEYSLFRLHIPVLLSLQADEKVDLNLSFPDPTPFSQHKLDQHPLCHRSYTRSFKLERKLSEITTKLTSAAFARDSYVSAGGKCARHLRREETKTIREQW